MGILDRIKSAVKGIVATITKKKPPKPKAKPSPPLSQAPSFIQPKQSKPQLSEAPGFNQQAAAAATPAAQATAQPQTNRRQGDNDTPDLGTQQATAQPAPPPSQSSSFGRGNEMTDLNKTPPSYLTAEQVLAIQTGNLQADNVTMQNVASGNVVIEKIPIIDKATRFLGIDTLGPEHYMAAIGATFGGGPSLFKTGGKETTWRIGKITREAGKATVNTRTIKLTSVHLSKFFSKNALKWYGAYAAAVGFGLWGAAEGPEGVSFPENKFLIPEAMKTGDWSLVDEAEAAKAEIIDLATWEKIALWSPISPFVGIPKKIEGNKIGAEIESKFIADKKKQAETGQTDEEYWKERDREHIATQQTIADNAAAVDRQTSDYINESIVKREASTRKKDKKFYEEQARFWEQDRQKKREEEKEDMIAAAAFWLEYRKQAAAYRDSLRPSQLTFGLI